MSRPLFLLAVAATCLAAADPPSRATVIAALLRDADVETRSPAVTRKAIVRVLNVITTAGAQPLDPADDPAVGWRRTVGRAEPIWRGRVLGPGYRRGRIGPGHKQTLEQVFLGGRSATVAVATDRPQRVTLTVIGPDSLPVCTHARLECAWTPRFTERYTVSVHNEGTGPARFYLVAD